MDIDDFQTFTLNVDTELPNCMEQQTIDSYTLFDPFPSNWKLVNNGVDDRVKTGHWKIWKLDWTVNIPFQTPPRFDSLFSLCSLGLRRWPHQVSLV